MPVLIIGNKNYSSWSLRPWLLLRHFGVEFEERQLKLDTPQFHAEIRQWSPNGLVPALHDDGLVVWDSLAICEYANERWLAGRGWPSDLQARARARAASAEMHSGFGGLRQQLVFNARRRPNAYHGDAMAAADIARVQELWRMLRAAHGAGGEFLCGEFGIVDAMYAPVALRFLSYGISMDAITARYVDALAALPALREWLADAYAEVDRIAKADAIGQTAQPA